MTLFLKKYKLSIISKLLYISFLLILINIPLNAQNVRDYIYFAELAYANGDYYSAADYLKKAIEQDPENIDIAYKLAEASRFSHAYNDSEKWYLFVKSKSGMNDYPLLNFNLASVKKNMGKYEEALQLFEEFYHVNTNDTSFILKKTQQEIKSCRFAIELMKDTVKAQIEQLSLQINTPYSEFNPFILGDSVLYFSSLRPSSLESPNALIPSSYNTKIYKSNLSIRGWSDATEIDNRINSRDAHNANICFNSDRTQMYFSRCFEERSNKMNCQLFVSKWENNRWSIPEKLSSEINVPGFTSTQPSWASFNGMNDMLFFVSDRPGGQGGLDIWYSVVNNNTIQTPINLGSFINTQGDEISPFFHMPSQTLYYSSDWTEGLGGFDIFKTKGYYSSWETPQNLGFPVNTSYNDIYYVMSEEYPEAYLTSNRPGSLYLKGETCCNDIFFVKFEKTIPDTVVEIVVIEDTVVTIVEKINELLPLTLYFHNDEPDPATTRTFTDKNYKSTLEGYLALKDIYIREYSSGLEGDLQLQAKADILDFYDTYIMGGFEKLERFTAWLSEDLSAGKTVQITIRGYCSPLNTSVYNINLSKRRISSLINFIKEYDNGSLLPYLNRTAENGGVLEIYEEPLGDREASPFVSNNPNDVRNSIYSRAAALERKVEIIQYASGLDSSDLKFPEITFSNPVHDFGNIQKGEKKVHIFTFRNTGNSSLFITTVETTSSNLVTDWKVKEILPGGSGDINVLFDSKNLNGSVSEYIYVNGNTNQGKITLEVKAMISE
ncbi:MAG: DUF1573 domain-containing protein [Bacteroidales bacterium]|nr:DUF1573 domain-containing protein [Bacteroidales bacterium]